MRSLSLRALLVAALAVSLLLGSVPFGGLEVGSARAVTVVRGPILGAVNFKGTSLTGMTEAEARTHLTAAAKVPTLDPTVIRAAGRDFTFDTRRAVLVNVEDMLNRAYAVPAIVPPASEPSSGSADPSATPAPLPTPVELRVSYTVRSDVVKAWVAKVAVVNRPKRNAYRKVVRERLKVYREVTGRTVKPVATRDRVTARIKYELADPARRPGTVAAKVVYYYPAITLKNIGKAILVDLSKRRVYLYKLRKVEKSYPCAIGMPGYATPRGKWMVTGKVKWPTWRNPGSAWASNMPSYIGPGPSNPLGTRAIYLSAPGIRIHGTSASSSIGHAASHGCIRLRRSDVENLYPRVPVGTSVWIIK